MFRKIFFSIIIFSIGSCITYRDIEFIDVHSISFSKENGCSPVCADLKVYNPNQYPILIKDIDVEAHLNDKKIGNVVNDKKIKLLKQDSIDIHLIFQSDAQQILTSLVNSLGFLLGKSQNLSLSGSLKAQVFLFKKKIDITYKTDFKDLSF
ncbi:MAG: LEA type 2 family protein [Bacteroidota bacterium]|nr:LEA type 2 family protein [Bacteroidota bacterium]